MDITKNQGVRIDPIDPLDWHIEGVTGIEGIVVNAQGDWRQYESPGEWQKDMTAGFETDACVSFSANDTLQTYGNYMIATGQWPQTTVDWLTAKGYLTNGKLHFSDRFTAMMSGTTQASGNSLPAVGNAIRKYGLVPESVWTFPMDAINANPSNAWDIYYSQPPASVLALGQESLKYLQVNYQWIVSSGNGAAPSQFAKWLQTAPIQIATAVCPPWNTSSTIQGCGIGAAHATQLSFVNNPAQTYQILDHYVPFDKELSLNYTLSYAVQYLLTAVLPPVVAPVQAPATITIDPIVLKPVAPIANPTPYQTSLLQQLLAALQALATALWTKPSSQGTHGVSLSYMTITPAQAGFIKGVLMVGVLAVVSFLANSANLTGVLSPVIATLAAGLFSSLESFLKSQSGNNTALFGAVKIS